MKTISIITPSYNQAHFIERTLESVIQQKGNFLIEYIVMDGGSVDGTQQILETYAKTISTEEQYQHITFIWKSEQDAGQSDAINKGLALATGDIVTYINSDDTYEPGCFAQVIQTLSESGVEWCYGKCHIIDEHDRIIRKRLTWYKNLRLQTRWSYGKLLTENFISQMTVFRTSKACEKIGYFNVDEHLCMDYEYRLRLGKEYRPCFINSYLANFRYYTTSKSGSQYRQQFADQLRLARMYADGNYRGALFIHKLFTWRTIIIYRILEVLGI